MASVMLCMPILLLQHSLLLRHSLLQCSLLLWHSLLLRYSLLQHSLLLWHSMLLRHSLWSHRLLTMAMALPLPRLPILLIFNVCWPLPHLDLKPPRGLCICVDNLLLELHLTPKKDADSLDKHGNHIEPMSLKQEAESIEADTESTTLGANQVVAYHEPIDQCGDRRRHESDDDNQLARCSQLCLWSVMQIHVVQPHRCKLQADLHNENDEQS